MLRLFLDLIFPPFCLSCEERCATKHLCPACWELCAPPDPAERCRHCFAELGERAEVCAKCRRSPDFPATRAYVFESKAPVWNLRFEKEAGIAGFALNQWIRLDWPLPCAIVPMPDSDSQAVGKWLSHWLQRPFIKGLKQDVEGLRLCPKGLEEGKEILLIDGSNPTKKLQEGVSLLSETFPKRIHVLSLIPCFTCY